MAHRIAVIAGDVIGTEVMPEGIRALEVAAKRFSIDLVFTTFELGSCDYYLEHGKMLPDDWLQFRRQFDQYINLRPCKPMPGIKIPLAGREPGNL